MYVVLGYIKISKERSHEIISRVAHMYSFVTFFMHRRINTLSLSTPQWGSCFTHLLNLLKILALQGGHENI